MPSLAVTDTHALIWAASGQTKRLGPNARRMFERVDQGRAVLYVPSIVLVEVGEAVHRGRVRFARGFAAWVDTLLSSGRYHAVDLTVPIVFRAQQFFAIPERGDRLVAATAAELDCPLLTCDPEIRTVAGIDVIW